ncbi:hypothetical protein [Nissabacter sp. SGAir0207]|uniref:hypothetical protein n=1 Tax=Nissabacter sp. SGAir0207 TaxID=2126321 RepID=UPI0010F5A5AC|nr:hypothetical protein [Nissabacter sp. SGAir0207]
METLPYYAMGPEWATACSERTKKVGNILPLHIISSTIAALAFRSFIKDMHKEPAALAINIAS